MKKIIPALSLLFIICASLLLGSCTTECTHDFLTSTTVAPTCGEEGYTLNTCTTCKSEFKTNYKLPTGHTLTETVFAPTCEKEGYTYYACVCGYSYTSEALPPSGHSYKETKVPVTCTTAGYTEYFCTVCEHTYKADFISATGHDMKDTVYAPSETAVGYTEHTCKTCQYSYKDSFKFYSEVLGGGYIDGATVVTKGIDVSYHQHFQNEDKTYRPLNWQAIKASGVDFAILRAGYTGYESNAPTMDRVFEMNYEDARTAGVMLGAYYYSLATTEEKLDEEVDALLDWLDGKQFEYPIYFDIEDDRLKELDRETLTKLCMRFVKRMRENGYYGAVYANKNWLNDYLYREALEGFCDIWYAHYTVSGEDETVEVGAIFDWSTEKYGSTLAMWQYTDSGIIAGSGIPEKTKVDINYSYKDYPSIIKTYGLNGYEGESLAVL